MRFSIIRLALVRLLPTHAASNVLLAMSLPLACLLATTARAGNLSQAATVVGISNTSNNTAENFSIKVSGGTGPCTNQWITFPLSAALDADTHKRAYAVALVALTSGLTVTVHSYLDDSCGSAAFIEAVR